MKKTLNPRFTVMLLMIAGAACTRFFSVTGHTALINFTPIGAMALFGGAYFSNKWKAVLFPLLTLFISDLIIEQLFYHRQYGTIIYDGWYWTYGAFTIMVFFGKWIIKKVSVKNVLLAAIAVSLSHWLITDFGTWLAGGLDITTGLPYTRNLEGLIKCYYLALPYMQDVFLGTIFYGAIMFGGFELAQKQYPSLQLSNA
jgi:hypothetical protein